MADRSLAIFRRSRWSLAFVLLVMVGYWLFAPSFWEQMLWGPYPGQPFNGSLPSTPTSKLSIGRDTQLEFYEVADVNAPVFVVRRKSKIKWQRLLIPERKETNGRISNADVSNAKLKHVVFDLLPGTKIRMRCDWAWGGLNEGGLIYLKSDYSFDHFALSW